jgi:hypothetical protein
LFAGVGEVFLPCRRLRTYNVETLRIIWCEMNFTCDSFPSYPLPSFTAVLSASYLAKLDYSFEYSDDRMNH